jgi:hypothetical protein
MYDVSVSGQSCQILNCFNCWEDVETLTCHIVLDQTVIHEHVREKDWVDRDPKKKHTQTERERARDENIG